MLSMCLVHDMFWQQVALFNSQTPLPQSYSIVINADYQSPAEVSICVITNV